MIKLIDKETGQEIKKFSVVNKHYCMRRDFINPGEGTLVEYDREYFDGSPIELIYSIIIKGRNVDKVYKIKRSDIESGGFIFDLCCIERFKFNIRQHDIDVSKKSGPFLIQGESRIIEI
jgi:hypothetical protein